ncbi:hypothetical protein FCM35_KLT21401 [Carex littledalei]|uniref:Uncharacterized protein n=1 Tax=Carex littledalei TaxID=544730 RepID=A0A833VD62_9POAL|nr:hypothetical protein FCM35_KLT21401 [Carex littledalei]
MDTEIDSEHSDRPVGHDLIKFFLESLVTHAKEKLKADQTQADPGIVPAPRDVGDARFLTGGSLRLTRSRRLRVYEISPFSPPRSYPSPSASSLKPHDDLSAAFVAALSASDRAAARQSTPLPCSSQPIAFAPSLPRYYHVASRLFTIALDLL